MTAVCILPHLCPSPKGRPDYNNFISAFVVTYGLLNVFQHLTENLSTSLKAHTLTIKLIAFHNATCAVILNLFMISGWLCERKK
jgi:hypothetical protein